MALDLFFSDRIFFVVYSALLALYLYLKFQLRRLAEQDVPLISRVSPLPAFRENAPAPPPAPLERLDSSARTVATLIRLVRSSTNVGVKVEAIRNLGGQSATEAIPVLGEALTDPDPEIATEAANALGQIGDPSAIDLLVRNTHRVAEELKRLSPLPGAIPGVGAQTPLEPQLPSPAWSDPGTTSGPPLTKILDPLARKGFKVLDRYTPYDLRKMSEPEIVDILIRIARNRAEAISNRYFALKNLSYFRHTDIGENLVALILDDQPTIRYTAAELLGSHGDDMAVAPLINALEDPNAYVRSSAALSLAALNSDRAIRPLMRLRTDPEEVVRYSVRKALDEIGRRKGLSKALLREAS